MRCEVTVVTSPRPNCYTRESLFDIPAVILVLDVVGIQELRRQIDQLTHTIYAMLVFVTPHSDAVDEAPRREGDLHITSSLLGPLRPADERLGQGLERSVTHHSIGDVFREDRALFQ